MREFSDAHGQRQGQSETKVAHNFPRSLLKIAHKRCNCNDMNSWFEVAAGELRATFKLHRCGGRRRGQRFNLFGNVQHHREDSTRSEGVEPSRSGVRLTTTSIFVNTGAKKPLATLTGSGRARAKQKSHIMSHGHFWRSPTNVAIATI